MSKISQHNTTFRAKYLNNKIVLHIIKGSRFHLVLEFEFGVNVLVNPYPGSGL